MNPLQQREDLLCSQSSSLFKWSLSSTRHLHAPVILVSYLALHHSAALHIFISLQAGIHAEVVAPQEHKQVKNCVVPGRRKSMTSRKLNFFLTLDQKYSLSDLQSTKTQTPLSCLVSCSTQILWVIWKTLNVLRCLHCEELCQQKSSAKG